VLAVGQSGEEGGALVEWLGKWPGDETDEEIAKALRNLS